MAYIYDLENDQRIHIENQKAQTIVTLSSSGLGQQQQSSSSIETGRWINAPKLYRTSLGFVLQIYTQSSIRYIQLEANGMSILTETPALGGADELSLRKAGDRQTVSPMKPFEPMKMGNMEMQMQPMKMQMGNMEMQMGTPAKNQGFCSQCGTGVDRSDRFCSFCGFKLT